MVATMLPFIPAIRCPMKIATLTAMSPGADWAMEIMSRKSSSSIHLFLYTTSLSIKGIIATPPPRVKAPIFAKIMNSFQYMTQRLKNFFKKIAKKFGG